MCLAGFIVAYYPAVRGGAEGYLRGFVDSSIEYELFYDTSRFIPSNFPYDLPTEVVFALKLKDRGLLNSTNLIDAYFLLTSGDSSICEKNHSDTLNVNGVDYRHSLVEDVAVGNLYTVHIFDSRMGKRCISIRFFIHSSSMSAYGDDGITQFDEEMLMDLFLEMLRAIDFHE